MGKHVSILIPCYNAAAWLHETLTSACSQTWKNREVIVVDDGSIDESLSIAREFETRGVRVLSQRNRGAAAARNAGLAEARGDFIQYLDADDLLAPDKIERQLAAESGSSVALTGRWGRFRVSSNEAWFKDDNPLFADLAPSEYLQRYAARDCMMHPAAWLLPRALVDRAGPWDERLSLNDDGEYFARVVAAASRIHYCAGAVSYYRSQLPTSLSAQRSRRHLESAALAATLIESHLLDLENSPAMRTAAANLQQRFAYEYYPSAPDLVREAERRARKLGKPTAKPLGGRFFSRASALLGWKIARRLQVMAGKFPTSAKR